MNPTLTITIDATGAVSIAVAGCPGPACSKLTEPIERALGRVTIDRKTAEHAANAEVARRKVGR